MSGRSANMVLIVAIVAGLAALALISAALLESRALTNPSGYRQPDPRSFEFSETPQTAAGLGYEDIEFAAPNGEAIRGWLIPAAGDAKKS